jgi:orotidine-5'-phosphate decarboxylase
VIERTKLAVALDLPDADSARQLARAIAPEVGWFKIGSVLYTRSGPSLVRELGELQPVFLDLKFHDIPQTVEGAVSAAAELGVSLLTVHAAGGTRMLERAARQTERASAGRCRVVAVTMLTSLEPADLGPLGIHRPLEEQVLALARLALEAGCAGVVCSPREVAAVRQALGPEAFLVTPGIRPAGPVAGDDQRRDATPAEAVAAGSSLLVVGRPIVKADDPAAAARRLLEA